MGVNAAPPTLQRHPQEPTRFTFETMEGRKEEENSMFETSHVLGAVLASSLPLTQAWSQCMRANAGGSSFTLERCDDAVYVAFSGVQTGVPVTHSLVPIGGGGHGLFSPLVGGEGNGGEPVLVHAAILHFFLALFHTNEFQMLAREIKNKAAIFTGHSIGGTLASLAALHFLCSSSSSTYPSPSTLLCITFGSPLLGNEALSRAVQRERWCGNFCHVVTRRDVVPRLLFCPLNLLPPQLVTHLLQPWQLLLQRPQVARPASVLSDQEEAHLHILISRHIDAAAAAAVEQEISDAAQRRSSYWPFGNYALCSGEGVVCFDDPLLVVRMLYSTFITGSASSSIEEEHLSYGDVLVKILENLLLKKRIAIEEAPESSFCAGISLALEASGIGIQDMGATKEARECLKMSKRMGRNPNLNSAGLAMKLAKITPWRAQIEWYKASCDDDMGYYDSFKLRKAPKKDSRTNMNRHRLAQFWDDLIDMLQSNQLPHDFNRRGKWVNAAHFYRLLVEPLDIAEYYRVQKHKKNGHYLIHGRERRHQVFEGWWRDRKKDSREGDNAKRSKFAGLTQDSCFWAKVEMAKEWLEDAGTESDPAKLPQLLESLKGFECYAKQMVERKEVSIDVLAPRSSYTLWVEEWKVLQLNLGLPMAP
ncbi:lipase-like PAD4 [Phoenix dactylifera]|uniref:Lipase-like PAD4 n=1 Tax=Phoenix dactylifera TaxID=42345 RepID=A0A8B7BML4_PHODC|nr:lipase-like PAD4 [Phoenix dactylifera]